MMKKILRRSRRAYAHMIDSIMVLGAGWLKQRDALLIRAYRSSFCWCEYVYLPIVRVHMALNQV